MTDALVINRVHLIIVDPPSTVVVVVVFVVVVFVIPVVPVDRPPVCIRSYHVTRNICFPSSVYHQYILAELTK
jgi:hypothetical protein